MTEAQLQEYRKLFIATTTALFMAVIGIVELTERVSVSFVHTFWPISGAGVICSVVWFGLCLRCELRGTSECHDRDHPASQVRRLFDYLLPIVLVAVWAVLMKGWAQTHPPPIHGWALILMIGSLILALSFWIIFGPDILGRRRRLTGQPPLHSKVTMAFRCRDCGSTWTFNTENPVSFERWYQRNRECLFCGNSNVDIDFRPLTGTTPDEGSGKNSRPPK